MHSRVDGEEGFGNGGARHLGEKVHESIEGNQVHQLLAQINGVAFSLDEASQMVEQINHSDLHNLHKSALCQALSSSTSSAGRRGCRAAQRLLCPGSRTIFDQTGSRSLGDEKQHPFARPSIVVERMVPCEKTYGYGLAHSPPEKPALLEDLKRQLRLARGDYKPKVLDLSQVSAGAEDGICCRHGSNVRIYGTAGPAVSAWNSWSQHSALPTRKPNPNAEAAMVPPQADVQQPFAVPPLPTAETPEDDPDDEVDDHLKAMTAAFSERPKGEPKAKRLPLKARPCRSRRLRGKPRQLPRQLSRQLPSLLQRSHARGHP